jgi:hypothetical protein
MGASRERRLGMAFAQLLPHHRETFALFADIVSHCAIVPLSNGEIYRIVPHPVVSLFAPILATEKPLN